MPKKAVLERLTILTNNDINPQQALEIERKSFHEPDFRESSLEDMVFLLEKGELLIAEEIDGIAESIPLQKFLEEDASALPCSSTLRMILENDRVHGTLRSIRDDYPNHANHHYGRRLGVAKRGRGYGRNFFVEWTKRIVNDNELMFGFLRASPPNLISIRMCLSSAVIDKIDQNVYEPGQAYFRFIYNGRTRIIPYVEEKVCLNRSQNGNRIEPAKNLISANYVGTRIEHRGKDYFLVFNKRI